MEKRTENYELTGIDISEWKSDLDIASIKDNVSFIILRSSLTYSGGEGTTKDVDAKFESFYAQCKQYNIPVGAYHFSCARTYNQGYLEAQYMYENCLEGKVMELPVYIDVEQETWQTKDKDGVTQAIRGFYDYMASVNWYAGVYANYNFFHNYIDLTKITDIDKWYALWGSTRPTDITHQIWQFAGDTYYIEGYSGGLDGNKMYFDYPAFMKENGYNGNTKPIPFYHQKGNYPFYILRRKKILPFIINNKNKYYN